MISISVIVCTYNRCNMLKYAIENLLNQENTTFDYEIIIVDNNSTDKTREVVSSCQQHYHDTLIYVFEPRQGKSIALNTGIQIARGEIIAFTDDDVSIDRRWLLNIWNCFAEHNCIGVSGRTLPVFPFKTPKWIIDNQFILRGILGAYDYGSGIMKYSKKLHAPFAGANMAYRRLCFEKYGMFSEHLGPGMSLSCEDTDYFLKVAANTDELYYCGDAILRHNVGVNKLSIKSISKWYFAIGRFELGREINEHKLMKPLWIFGVPKYYLRLLFASIIRFIVSVFSREDRLNNLLKLFRLLGFGYEYRLQAIKWARDEKTLC